MPEVPSRVAVTGAAGFFGLNLIRRLVALEEIECVIATDIRGSDALPSDQRLEFTRRDARESHEDLYADAGVEAVFHLAYIVRPPRSPARARTVNVVATQTLLDTCTALGIRRFIYPSSATVYGARPGNHRPFTESDPPHPLPGFHYSVHKVEAERLIARWAADVNGAIAVTFRGCPVMGKDGKNFILDTLKLRLLPVPAFQNPPMQFLHIDDQTAAFEVALRTEESGLYNIAGSDSVDWRKMASLFGNRPIPVPGPLLKAGAAFGWATRLQSKSPGSGINFIQYPWTISIQLAEQALGWRPRFTSEQALMAAK